MAIELNEISDIKHLRKKLGLTQGELAKRANVSQSLIAKVESGRLDPAYSKAKQIFAALESLSKQSELKAGDVMRKNIISVLPSDDVKSAVQKMKKYEISQLPVLKENDVLGLISESSVLDALMEGKAGKVEDVMHETPPIVHKDTSIDAVSHLMKFSPVVLVSDKGRIVGLISKADLIGRLYK